MSDFQTEFSDEEKIKRFNHLQQVCLEIWEGGFREGCRFNDATDMVFEVAMEQTLSRAGCETEEFWTEWENKR